MTARMNEDLIRENKQLQRQINELKSLIKCPFDNDEHNIQKLPIELIAETAQETIVVIQDERYMYANKRAAEITGYSVEEMYSKHLRDIVYHEDYDKVISSNIKRINGYKIKYRHRIIDKKGQMKHLESFGIGILWEGQPATLCFLNDITAQINAENALRKNSQILEQTNTALNVLLKHREEDLNDVEEKVINNINKLILPYLEKVKAFPLNSDVASYIDIIERHVHEITSPFLQKLSRQFLNLTPREIQIASLIRSGKPTKEISTIMNIAISTVDNHRKSIRKKLGLKSKKDNLQSFLMSLK